LTILPQSWSIKEIEADFQASNYMVWKAKECVNAKGISSTPIPKPGKMMKYDTVKLDPEFCDDDEINTRDYWVFGLWPSSCILKNTKEHIISESGCYHPQVRGWETPTLLGPLGANPNHWTKLVKLRDFQIYKRAWKQFLELS
jgi:hypothetical protein